MIGRTWELEWYNALRRENQQRRLRGDKLTPAEQRQADDELAEAEDAAREAQHRGLAVQTERRVI